MWSDASLSISGTTFSGNTTTAGYGGGVYSEGNTTILHSTVTGNSAALIRGSPVKIGIASPLMGADSKSSGSIACAKSMASAAELSESAESFLAGAR